MKNPEDNRFKKKNNKNIRKSFNNCYYFYYVTLFLFKIHTHRKLHKKTQVQLFL